MNTKVWLISFTDSSGKQAQTVHTHNCIADYRLLDPNATVRAIDCVAVADLIEAANQALAFIGYDGTGAEKIKEDLRAALEKIGSAS